MIDFTKSYNPLTPQLPSYLFEDMLGYSDQDVLKLKDALAGVFQTPLTHIALDNASSGVIEKILSSFHDSVVLRAHDFFLFENIANAYDQKIVKIDFDRFIEKLDAHLNGLDNPRGRHLVMFSLVNNYDASMIDIGEIERMAHQYPRVNFVIDGAYFEYTGINYQSLNRLLSCPNVSYMSTFSKCYGLAGLRIGYLLSHNIEQFYPIELKFKISTIAARAAHYLLFENLEFYFQTLDHFQSQKNKLARHGFTPTCAHKVIYQNTNGKDFFQFLNAQHINSLPIYYQGKPALAFSIKSEAENQQLIDALQMFKNV